MHSQASAISPTQSALIKKIELVQHNNSIPALGLVLIQPNAPVVVKAWGRGGANQPITEHTPFRWGSITKTFTALALLELVEQQHLDLLDPVNKFIPPDTFTNCWRQMHRVALIDLLELTGGFADLSAKEFSNNEPLSLTNALALDPDARRTYWRPGIYHSYSNLAPGLSAAVIEKRSGITFERYLKERVLAKLQMTRASLLPLADLPGGFKADGKTPIPYWQMTYRAFGALNASVAEMHHFLQMLVQQGKTTTDSQFSAKVIERLFHPLERTSKPALAVDYASGMYSRLSHGQLIHGHGGDADGYRSRYGVIPEHGTGYLVVINTDNPGALRRLVRLIEAHLTQTLTPLSPPPETAMLNSEAVTIGGTYYPATIRFGLQPWLAGNAEPAAIEVRLKPGTANNSVSQLTFLRGSKRIPLIYLGKGRLGEHKFRRSNDLAATIAFHRPQTIPGRPTLETIQGELGNYARLNPAPAPTQEQGEPEKCP